MNTGLEVGEHVYVRMEIRREMSSEGTYLCRLTIPSGTAWGRDGSHYVPVPRSQIVAIEPRVMEVDGGIVKPFPV